MSSGQGGRGGKGSGDGFDAVVAGGGPAGSTAATLLAQEGFKVALIEREHHPRFHIGESLLPHTTPVLGRLGVLDRMAGFAIEKRGADFTTLTGERREIDFARALNPRADASPAFQVHRAEFDAMLFENAAAHGVETLQGWAVREVDLAAPGGVRLELRGPAGETRMIDARELIDASGRDGLLARKFGLRTVSRRHQSAAVYAHFEGVVHQESRIAGNISVYWFEHGWMWMIPLLGGKMSVGAVAGLPHMRSRQVPLEQFLADTIAQCPGVAARMTAAAARTGPVLAASNYSYGASRMWGPNWSLAGDAFAFVDPVFSSGVHFAMAGTEIVADAVAARLAGTRDAVLRFRDAEHRIRCGLARMSWLIHRFNTTSTRRLFMNPRDIVGMERAILAVLAGDLFGRTRLGWRFELFKLVYAIGPWTRAGNEVAAARPGCRRRSASTWRLGPDG